MKKRMIIMLIGCAVVFGGVFGMKAVIAGKTQAFFDNRPVPAKTISTARAQAMDWAREVHSVGTFTALQGTDVTTEVEGIVKTLHFKSGQRVAAGDRLVSLQSEREKATLEQLRAQARLADIKRQRSSDLFERRAISRSEYDAAIAEAQAARAAVDAQAAQLALKEIRAPFAGVLGIRRVNEGQFLAPGTPIVSLQSLSPIAIEFAVPEKHFAKLQAQLPISVQVGAYPETTFDGTLTVIQPVVEAATRLVHVRATLANAEEKLRAGMFGRVTVTLPGQQRVVAVPRTAIKYDPYGSSVFLVQEKEDAAEGEAAHVARHRFVRTGEAHGDFVAITDGLEAGDEVVATGLLKLRNGQPIEIDNELQPGNKLTVPQSDS